MTLNQVQFILEQNGPLLTSDIKEILMKNNEISDIAARQQVSRTKGDVKRLRSFSFPKNEFFLFLENQYKTDKFYLNLRDALLKSRSSTGNTISALQCLSGKVSEQKFKVLAGAISGAKRKKIDTISNELESVDIIQKLDDGTILLSSQLSKQNELSESVIETLDEILFANLQEWLRKNSFVSYNTIRHYGEFSDYYWDITAPSYLKPFVTRGSDTIKPGFVVIDYFPQKNVDVEAVEYFINKITSIESKKNIRPFLPMFIALSYQHEALEKLRANNVLATTVSNLFGKENEKLLYSIIDTINDINKRVLKDDSIKSINTILKSVANLEGKFNNLKGTLFEMLTANAMFTISRGYVEIGKKLYEDKLVLAEIDVMCVLGNSEVHVIECKAYKSSINEKQIDEWKQKISKIYGWLRQRPENTNKTISFDYWTTSEFTDEALALLTNIKSFTRKYSVGWKNKNDIIAFFKKHNLQEQCNVLNEFY